MKRRGFLGFLGLAAGAAAGGSVAAEVQKNEPTANPQNGIVVKSTCPSCETKLEQFVDLTKPMAYGNQCPRCFAVLHFSDEAAAQVIEWNDKFAEWKGYRPKVRN